LRKDRRKTADSRSTLVTFVSNIVTLDYRCTKGTLSFHAHIAHRVDRSEESFHAKPSPASDDY
jgi:hypothetical protein